MTTLRRLLALSPAPRRQTLAAAASAPRRCCTASACSATSGYLISRAARASGGTVADLAIVGVRFFGLARPVPRLPGAAQLARSRRWGARAPRVPQRGALEPLAPARLEGLRNGDLLCRLVADVDTLQDLHLRGLTPPPRRARGGALVADTAAGLPAAPPCSRQASSRRDRGAHSGRPASKATKSSKRLQGNVLLEMPRFPSGTTRTRPTTSTGRRVRRPSTR